MSLITILNESALKAVIDQYDITLMEPKVGSSYSIPCDGDIVVGDTIEFEKDIWGGSYNKPKHMGTEKIEGQVISDSYGADKGQHTFRIKRLDKSQDEFILIKGRNLYKYPVNRKPWNDEEYRKTVADDKHGRGAKNKERKNTKKDFDF